MPFTGVTGHRNGVGCSHPAAVLWVPGLPEIVHSLTEDLEVWGYRPSGLWGQWQLQSVGSISTGDERRPSSPRRGRGKAERGNNTAASKPKA